MATASTKPKFAVADSEALVAAAVIQDRSLAHRIFGLGLVPEDFTVPAYAAACRAVRALMSGGRPVDPVLVAQESGGVLSRLDAEALAAVRVLPENAVEHARRVRKASLVRKFVVFAGEFARNPGRDDFRSVLQELLRDMDVVEVAPVKLGDAAEAAAAEIADPVKGVEYGFKELDRVTGGMRPGELVILAARPGMGKSSFATQVAVGAALRGCAVYVVSLEVTAVQVARKALAQATGLPIRDMAPDRLGDALACFAELLLWIDDGGRRTPSEVVSTAKILRTQAGLDLVVIDYLQLMRSGKKHVSQYEEVTAVSRDLKGVAKELGVPVLALSQLTREVEDRTDKRPVLRDLRGSGALEQDADTVLFLYREKYYRPDADDWAEIIVAKQREGPTGVVKLKFDPETTRFLEEDMGFE